MAYLFQFDKKLISIYTANLLGDLMAYVACNLYDDNVIF